MNRKTRGDIVADWQPEGRNLPPEEISRRRNVPIDEVIAVIAEHRAACAAEHERKAAALAAVPSDPRIVRYGNGTYGIRASEKDRSWT
jgi:hypothetical protein